MLKDLRCKGCEAGDAELLVFVGTLRRNGKIEQLGEGMHSYCEPCRKSLGISDELNAGRDLRAEAKRVTLDAVAEARKAEDQEGISIIFDAVDPWVGGTDAIFRMMGQRRPERPPAAFDGVSDALAEIDPATMTIGQALGLISITNAVRGQIENWQDFVQRTHRHLQNTMPDEADEIMQGFN